MKRAASSTDDYAYAAPDPVAVAKLVDSHGMDAACARWHWKTSSALSGIAKEGRSILRGRSGDLVRPARRTTTPEVETRILYLARATGSASLAARGMGVSESLVRTLHVERGLEIPTLPASVHCAKAAATRRARGSGEEPARSYKPRTLDEDRVLADWRAGKTVKEMVAAYGGSHAPIYRLLSSRGAIKGVAKKLPDDAVIQADVLAGMGQHAMAKKYGCTRGAVCFRIKELGLIGKSAIPRSVRKLPPDDVLRADRAAGLTLRPAAALYGVSSSVVGKHWKRLGIDGRLSDLKLQEAA